MRRDGDSLEGKITMSESKDKETYKVELKRRKGSVLYDQDKDIIDFEGHLFTGDFLRTIDEQIIKDKQRKDLYAAILKVPLSGTPWLDEMIEASRRDEFAKAYLSVAFNNEEFLRKAKDLSLKKGMDFNLLISKSAYQTADAMIEASKPSADKRKEGE